MSETSRKVFIVAANQLRVRKLDRLARPLMIAPQIFKVFLLSVVAPTVTHKNVVTFCIQTLSIMTTFKRPFNFKKSQLIVTMQESLRVDHVINLTNLET